MRIQADFPTSETDVRKLLRFIGADWQGNVNSKVEIRGVRIALLIAQGTYSEFGFNRLKSFGQKGFGPHGVGDTDDDEVGESTLPQVNLTSPRGECASTPICVVPA